MDTQMSHFHQSSNMSGKKTRKVRIFRRLMKASFRVLIKARDFYIQSLSECSGHFEHAAPAMSFPPGHTLPRNFSITSTRSNASEDYKELVRAASTRTLGQRIELDLRIRQQSVDSMGSPLTVPRSYSVGMGRIDEDKVCDFGNDHVNIGLYPRSKSVALRKRAGLL